MPPPTYVLVDARDPAVPLPMPALSAAPELDLSVVVPAYNERDRLPPMLAETLDYFDHARPTLSFELIVVDDGSSDDTAAVVTAVARARPAARLRVLTQSPNAGKGAAVRAGMRVARGRRALMADADAATTFADLEALEAALAASGADVAVGSRKAGRGDDDNGKGGTDGSTSASASASADRSAFRALLSFVFHLLVVLVAGVSGVRDTQCGFKLFSRRAARAAFDGQMLDRWAFDVENLYRVQRAGMTVVEVPVHWTEVPGSKISVVKATLNMAFDMLRMRVHYVTGRWTLPPRVAPSASVN